MTNFSFVVQHFHFLFCICQKNIPREQDGGGGGKQLQSCCQHARLQHQYHVDRATERQQEHDAWKDETRPMETKEAGTDD